MRFVFTFILIIPSLFSYSQKPEQLYRLARLHYQNMEFNEALDKVDEAIDKGKKYYDAYLLRADIYYSVDDTAKAFADLRKTIEYYPKADRSYFLIGMIYFDYDMYDEAWSNFTKSTELYKNDAEYFYYKGETALKLNNIKEACIAWDYGGNNLEDDDSIKLFKDKCDGIDLTIPKKENLTRKSLKQLLKN